MGWRLVQALLIAACGAIGASCDWSTPASETRSGDVQQAAGPVDPSASHIYLCPMDRDIRSHGPGHCPRCGMALVAGIPEPAEYHLDLRVDPVPVPGRRVHLTYEVADPWKGNPVTRFGVVHEKLFHAFVVSRDLEFFVHDHPEWKDGAFHADIAFPKPGLYRILGDFYPEASTPQLLTQTVVVAGDEPPLRVIGADYSPKQAENLRVELSTSPATAIAANATRLRVTVSPGSGLERLLGSWGHVLAASDDLIDMMHEHPSLADGGPEMQFTVIFPRPRVYRIWVQVQRDGVINTAHFDVPVRAEGDGRP